MKIVKQNIIVSYPKEKHFPYSQMYASLNKNLSNMHFVKYAPNKHQKYLISKILKIIIVFPKLYKITWEHINKAFNKFLIKKISKIIRDSCLEKTILIINQDFPKSTLNNLINKNINLQIVFYFTDQIEKCKIRTDIWKNPDKYYANMIISYDSEDAKRHGVMYYPNPYSEIKDKCILKLCSREKYDVCFIGAMKDRHEKIIEAYNHFIKLGLNVFFYVTYEKHHVFKKHEGIVYSYRSTTYKKYLKYFAQSRCILDITQGNSKAYTTRIAESVMLEKKLITNNWNVRSLPFYDQNKMYVYNGSLNVNNDFFKKNTKVSYDKNAKEYFNPYKFIEFIDKNL